MDRHTNTHTEKKSKYFNGHSRPSQSGENECMWAHDKDGITRVFERCHQGVARGDGGKFERRLITINQLQDYLCNYELLSDPLHSFREYSTTKANKKIDILEAFENKN